MKKQVGFQKGRIPWNKGKKTGKNPKHSEWMKENGPKYWLGKKRLNMVGDKNPKWKGGKSKNYKTGYYSFEYRQWRMKIFERDGFKCQGCEIVGTYLTAHHIKSFAKYPELRFVIDNGITLCEECHKLTDNYKGRNKSADLK